MSPKKYYIFNNQTGEYEPVPILGSRLRTAMWVVTSCIVLCTVLILLVFFFFGSPQDELLKRENERLKTQYALLQHRVDDAMIVLEDLQQRDDNLYRVVMQADPIGRKVRNAGVDNAARYAELLQMSNGQLVASVTRDVDRLSRNLYVQDNSFNELVDLAHQQEDRLQHIPAIQPVAQKDVRRIGSGFGWRIDPISGLRTYHDGLDLSANTGVPVYLTGDATVTFTGWKQGYGRTIEVDHGYGYVTRYAHLHKIEVQKGQSLKRGVKIGQVGSSGKSTGPHLHYEVIFRGRNVDPINYFFLDLSPEEYDRLIQEVGNL